MKVKIKKQMKALEEYGKQLVASNANGRYDYDFNDFVEEREDEILKLNEEINYSNLTYQYLNKNSSKSFNGCYKVISFLKKKSDRKITLRKAK